MSGILDHTKGGGEGDGGGGKRITGYRCTHLSITIGGDGYLTEPPKTSCGCEMTPMSFEYSNVVSMRTTAAAPASVGFTPWHYPPTIMGTTS